MIDIHSHILPGIDDGSKDIKMTLEMLKMARVNGTKSIFLTPHYCLEFAETPYVEVKDLVYKVGRLAEAEGIDIEIYPGQEIYFFDGMVDRYKEGIIGTLNNSRYMLIELSMKNYDKGFFDGIYELQVQGIVPVLAHPERYSYIINDPSFVNRFTDENILFQLNAGSILGKYGKNVKKTAEILMKNNIYSFIGSDAHNVSSRTVIKSDDIDLIRAFDKKQMNQFISNGQKLIKDEHIEFLGNKIKSKKNIYSFFKTK